MRKFKLLFFALVLLMSASFLFIGCPNGNESNGSNIDNLAEEITPGGTERPALGANAKIRFLHHSTGNNVWNGGVEKGITDYNTANSKSYQITQENYPAGGGNYPYEYWNLWVNNQPDSTELKKFTDNYNVIIWKHCFPVSTLSKKGGAGDVKSSQKTLENYKLQYNALKAKMKEFTNIRFIVWTGAVQYGLKESQANAMAEFVNWVKTEWDEPNDNIYIWDFYTLETAGNKYVAIENIVGERDSHPNPDFCKRVAPLFVNRIVNVIEGRGDTTNLTGK